MPRRATLPKLDNGVLTLTQLLIKKRLDEATQDRALLRGQLINEIEKLKNQRPASGPTVAHFEQSIQGLKDQVARLGSVKVVESIPQGKINSLKLEIGDEVVERVENLIANIKLPRSPAQRVVVPTAEEIADLVLSQIKIEKKKIKAGDIEDLDSVIEVKMGNIATEVENTLKKDKFFDTSRFVGKVKAVNVGGTIYSNVNGLTFPTATGAILKDGTVQVDTGATTGSNYALETFTATAGQTVYNVANTVAVPEKSWVYVCSHPLVYGVDYTVAGTTVTLVFTDYAIEAGDRIQIRYFY